MNGLTWGFWAIADQGLQWIGRRVAWLFLRSHSTNEESALYAAIGGALVCALFGGFTGFVLSDHSRNLSVTDGIILGSSLGVCLGILFGSSVATVDTTIAELLRSFNSK